MIPHGTKLNQNELKCAQTNAHIDKHYKQNVCCFARVVPNGRDHMIAGLQPLLQCAPAPPVVWVGWFCAAFVAHWPNWDRIEQTNIYLCEN